MLKSLAKFMSKLKPSKSLTTLPKNTAKYTKEALFVVLYFIDLSTAYLQILCFIAYDSLVFLTKNNKKNFWFKQFFSIFKKIVEYLTFYDTYFYNTN